MQASNAKDDAKLVVFKVCTGLHLIFVTTNKRRFLVLPWKVAISDKTTAQAWSHFPSLKSMMLQLRKLQTDQIEVALQLYSWYDLLIGSAFFVTSYDSKDYNIWKSTSWDITDILPSWNPEILAKGIQVVRIPDASGLLLPGMHQACKTPPKQHKRHNSGTCSGNV